MNTKRTGQHANPQHPRFLRLPVLRLIIGALALAGVIGLVILLFHPGPVREKVVGYMLRRASASNQTDSNWARRIESLGAEETVWHIHETGTSKTKRNQARIWLGVYALQHGSSDLKQVARTRRRSVLVDESADSFVRSEIAALFVLAENGLNDAYMDLLLSRDWKLAQDALWRLTGWRTTIPRGAALALGLARIGRAAKHDSPQAIAFRRFIVEGTRRTLTVELRKRMENSKVEQEYLQATSKPGAWRDLGDDLTGRLFDECLDLLCAMGECDGDLAEFVVARMLVDSYVLPEEGEFNVDRLQERSNALLTKLLVSEGRESFIRKWSNVLWRHWGGDEKALEALRRTGEEAQADGRMHAHSICVAATRLLSDPPPEESQGGGSEDTVPADRVSAE